MTRQRSGEIELFGQELAETGAIAERVGAGCQHAVIVLLITRLLRFTDLQRGMPGIAPNLLAHRLRDLEGNNVVCRKAAAPPAAGTLYALTGRGAQLEGVVRELLKWGSATVADAPADVEFQVHWLSMPARYLARDNDPAAPESVIRFGTPTDGFDLTVGSGRIEVAPCDAGSSPHAWIDGPGPVLVRLLQGAIPLATATAQGATIKGDRRAVQRVLPLPDRSSSRP